MIIEDAGGGGGTQPFCAISPSDLVKINENWLSRIEALEKAVSQLLAVNISATQLSDLSEQIGWITGITYMGVPGWTMTEAGSLIPPPGFSLSGIGFTLSDGNTYTGVSLDSDGVIQFGFEQNGTIAGIKPAQWDLGYANAFPDYYLYLQGTGMTFTGNPYTSSKGITLLSSTGLDSDAGFILTVEVSQAGLYSINCSGAWAYTNSGQSSCMAVALISSNEFSGSTANRGWAISNAVNGFQYIGGIGDPNISVTNPYLAAAATTILDLPALATINCEVSPYMADGATITGRDRVNVAITRLGKGAA